MKICRKVPHHTLPSQPHDTKRLKEESHQSTVSHPRYLKAASKSLVRYVINAARARW